MKENERMKNENGWIKLLSAISAMLVFAGCVSPRIIPEGRLCSQSGDWMEVKSGVVTIGRKGQAAYATLDNRANGDVQFDKDDLVQKSPQRLVLHDDSSVEYIRDESAPFPRQSTMFVPTNDK